MPLPQTERTPGDAASIDAMPPREALAAMLDGQSAAVASVASALPQIEAAAALAADTLRAGGRLVYVAAGSSGLMALADGCELPGTFGVAQDQIVIRMAGGVPADGAMPGETEDDAAAARDVAAALTGNDLVIALSASGTTPYSCEVARRARAAGVKIVAIACNPGAELLADADAAICLPTPPEVLAGSTRLGAGTAQKVALNMMSTLAGVLLGHVHDGMMVNLRADNAKLRGRSARMVARIAGVDDAAARAALETARGDVKLAVLLASGATEREADDLLRQCHGDLRRCLAEMQRPGDA